MRSCVLLLLSLCLAGCAAETPPAPAAPASPSQSSDPDARPLVVFLGDSLTAGYGLAEDQAFPALVARQLRGEGTPMRMVNAGVSGDTSAGGLGRLDWLLSQEPDVVVVGLGANDGLRGLDLEMTEANLRKIIRHCRDADASVLLLGMLIPPNYGPEYGERFAALYPEIAADLDVPLVPFLLEGVAGDPELNQADGIHPTARGQEIVAGTVTPFVRQALADR